MISGTIEGGGKVFFEIAKELSESKEYIYAKDIIVKSLKAPFFQILENAAVNKDEILKQVDDHHWFDAKNKQIVDLRINGIIDPASVAISAITNALSIAGIVLTTDCAIISKKEKEIVSEENLI